MCYAWLFPFLLVVVSGTEAWCIGGANGDIIACGNPRVAGAIDYIAWNNMQFINSDDHGRELQIAISNQYGECYNPTEAGSLDDGLGPTTTSKLLGINVTGNVYRTTTLPAFWLRPGQRDASGCTAVNTSPLSNYRTSKSISIGTFGIWNCMQFLISIISPENQSYLQVEAPTAYLPDSFSSFWLIDLTSGQLTPTSAGPGETADPVIIGTPTGSYAMGAYLASANVPYVKYARFFFPGPEPYGTSKWSVVWRTWSGVTPGMTLSFASYICLGTLAEVQSCMVQAAHNSGFVRCTAPNCN